MRDGKIVKDASGGYEEISIEDAARIADRLGVPVPPLFISNEAGKAGATATPKKTDQDSGGREAESLPKGPDSPSIQFIACSIRAPL